MPNMLRMTTCKRSQVFYCHGIDDLHQFLPSRAKMNTHISELHVCPLFQKCLISPDSPVRHSAKEPSTMSWLRLQQCAIVGVHVLLVLTK